LATYAQLMRQLVGRAPLFEVGVIMAIWNTDRHVLTCDTIWGIVSGTQELGESIRQTVHRVVSETCGITIQIDQLVGVYSHPKYSLDGITQPWLVGLTGQLVSGTLPPTAKFRPVEQVRQRVPALAQQFLQDVLQCPPQHMCLEPAYTSDYIKSYFPILRAVRPKHPILLPGAVMVVRNDAGEFLMIKRADMGTWDFPAGLSDLGETATATAVRETYEETGLHVKPIRALGLYSEPHIASATYPNGDIVQTIGMMVEGQIVSGTLTDSSDEVHAVRFWDIDTVRQQPNMRELTLQRLHDIQHITDKPILR